MEELDAAKDASAQQSIADKDCQISFEPDQLIADAKKFAGKDKVILAYAKQAEKNIKKGVTTRGAVGGARYHTDRVYSYDTDVYKISFWAGERAQVMVIGDGDTDLDLYIYDENGNLIDKDDDYTDDCICSWTPSWTGSFTIKIKNRGGVYNEYLLTTN